MIKKIYGVLMLGFVVGVSGALGYLAAQILIRPSS